MAWPPNWNLNAAWQRANALGLAGGIMVLEDWRDNFLTPWGQGVDNDLQDHGRRIIALDGQGVKTDNALFQKIPGMENRIDALEGRMGNVEKKCRKNGQAVNNLDKKMNQAIEGIEKLLGQQRGGLGAGFGGGNYANGQNAYQQGFINMIHQQQQVGPVTYWAGFAPPPPAQAPATAPAPFLRMQDLQFTLYPHTNGQELQEEIVRNSKPSTFFLLTLIEFSLGRR